MSWKKEIKKYDAKAEVQKALGRLTTLKTQYNIKDEDFEGIREVLMGLLQNMSFGQK